MSSWQNAVITNKGLALQAKMLEGKSLKITKAVAGAGYVNPTLLQQQTAVTTIKNALTIKSVRFPETGVCAIRVALSNAGVLTGYTANQIGIYAEDPDEGEILYFIAQADSNGSGVDVPTEANVPSYASEWEFYFKFGNADGVNVTISAANAVSRQEFEETFDGTIGKAMQKALDDKVDTPVATSGKVISVAGSADAPFNGLIIHGKTTQVETTGAQLFNFEAWKGVPVLHGNSVVVGNKITLTATDEDCYTGYGETNFPIAARIPVTPGESYVLSWETDSASGAKNETYVFFDGTTDGLLCVNAALKQIAFTVPEGKTFVTIRFGVRAAGASASYWNIMVNSGYTQAEYEPYTSGLPSPSPAYSQDMVCIENPVLYVAGKNLFDGKLTNGIYRDNSFTVDPGEGTYATGVFNSTKTFLTAGTYTMSFSTPVNIVRQVMDGEYKVMSTHNGVTVYEFTANTNGYFGVTFRDTTSIDKVWDASNTIQIEKGSTATAHEEFKGYQSINVLRSLHGVPVDSGGNYTDEDGQQWVCDEVDFARGVYVKRVGTATLTGTEAWSEGSSIENGMHRFYIYVNDLLPVTSGYGMSTHYVRTSLRSHEIDSECVRFGDNNKAMFFYSSTITNVEDWQNYVAGLYESGTPIKVEYVAETPVETALTPEEVALYAALHTYNPHTSIYNSVGAEMTSKHYTPNASLPIAGGAMAGAINMGGHKITGLGEPTESGDAVNKAFVEEAFALQNPTMEVGVEYRTAELNEGKTVYVKKIDLGTFPASGQKSTMYYTAGSTSVSYEAYAITPSGYVSPLPYFSSEGVIGVSVTATPHSVIVFAQTDVSTLSGFAIVRYTKD